MRENTGQYPPIKTEQQQPTMHQNSSRYSLCVGCGGLIHDQFILRVAPDLEWHAKCLRCAACKGTLDDSTSCYVKDGKTYCRKDYFELFSVKCAECKLAFEKTDFIMKAANKIFHVECFRCGICNRQLLPGDEFALRKDGIYCREDSENLDKNGNSFSEENHEQAELSPDSCLGDDRCGCKQEEKVHTKEKKGKDGKPTRVRTVLNEKQLHTLRTCYNANPRPDALMKEQLTEMTALSPRVIRVWFQNKRCKDKKRSLAMKQIHQMQVEKNINGLSGVPMVAASPVRQDLESRSFSTGYHGYGMHGDMPAGPYMLNYDNGPNSVMSDGIGSPGSDCSLSIPSD
uniref:ISL1-like protein n=1 Tax=Hofstenia miamia TaxID=442651 RepID=A0A5P8I4L9_HOFMI|nr:ISL1-like protein [Hofstenia miamia]